MATKALSLTEIVSGMAEEVRAYILGEDATKLCDKHTAYGIKSSKINCFKLTLQFIWKK